MNTTVVWVITAMLWWQGPGEYGYTEYEAKQFQGRGECLDYIWDNKADLVEGLFEMHGHSETGERLKTWGFYCEARRVETTDI